MSKNSRRVTIKDIASRAGVSTSTVSRVLKANSPGQSEEIKRRVLEAVKQLGYTSNSKASPLTETPKKK